MPHVQNLDGIHQLEVDVIDANRSVYQDPHVAVSESRPQLGKSRKQVNMLQKRITELSGSNFTVCGYEGKEHVNIA